MGPRPTRPAATISGRRGGVNPTATGAPARTPRTVGSRQQTGVRITSRKAVQAGAASAHSGGRIGDALGFMGALSKALRIPLAGDQRFAIRDAVEGVASRGHPLGVAVGDEAATTVGVLMPEYAVEHVVTVSKPRWGARGALGLARAVVHLAHLIQVHERVRAARSTPANTPHREAFTLQARRRRGDRHHGAIPSCRVGVGDPWQDNGVGADSWHDRSLCCPGDYGVH